MAEEDAVRWIRLRMLRGLLSFSHQLHLLFLLHIGCRLLAPLLHLQHALVDSCPVLGFQHYLVSAQITQTHLPFLGEAVDPETVRHAFAQLGYPLDSS